MASNVTFQSRNVLSKKFMVKKEVRYVHCYSVLFGGFELVLAIRTIFFNVEGVTPVRDLHLLTLLEVFQVFQVN